MGFEETRIVARWVLDHCHGAYGPHRGLSLLDLDPAELHDSAAAIRDLPSVEPSLALYRRLAKDIHQIGDQGTLALLLAAGTVEQAHRAMDDGVPRAAILEGLALAARQLRTWLPSQATQSTPATLMPAWHEVLEGLRRWGEAGAIDLDAVDICEAEGPLWRDGLRIEPHGQGDRLDARVLMLQEGPRLRLRHDAQWGTSGVDAEEQIVREFLDKLDLLGVDVLLVATPLGDLRDRVAGRCLVQDDAPEPLRTRMAGATGAKLVTRIQDASSAELGQCDVTWTRRGGWLVEGPGPGATICLGKHAETMAGLLKDRAERALRLCGTVLVDPRSLPGAGRWQADAAQALLRMKDLAPGKAGFGVECVAAALQETVRMLRRQAGLDPFDEVDLGDVLDAAPAVERAVDGALQVAQLALRIDGRHSKKASQGVDLRGGTGPAGSPKGMPGDIPPLM